MKTRRYILLILAGLIVFLAGFFIGKGIYDSRDANVTETKETSVDTILHVAPAPKSELATGTRRYSVPTYYFVGGWNGAELRQGMENDSIRTDTVSSIQVYGIGSGGEPRCSKDSAIVELPIIQRHYADSTYEAWVSGPIDPQLDSVRVFASTTIITKREWKPPKRWHIGITAGYGYGTKGFQPYIGVGITYSLFSF